MPIDPSKIEEFRLHALDTLSGAENLYIEESIKTESNFRNLQFTFATILFTFTSPIFNNPKLLSGNEKILFLISWLFIFVSIIAGVIQIIFEIRFYTNSSKVYDKQARLFTTYSMSESDYRNVVKEKKNLSETFPKYNRIPLILQTTFISLSFIFILVVASLTLFNK